MVQTAMSLDAEQVKLLTAMGVKLPVGNSISVVSLENQLKVIREKMKHNFRVGNNLLAPEGEGNPPGNGFIRTLAYLIDTLGKRTASGGQAHKGGTYFDVTLAIAEALGIPKEDILKVVGQKTGTRFQACQNLQGQLLETEKQVKVINKMIDGVMALRLAEVNEIPIDPAARIPATAAGEGPAPGA